MSLPSVLDEIDRLFEELVRRPWGSASALVPAAIREVADGWVVELPNPGLAASDIRIDVHGRQLQVSGRRRRQHEHVGPAAWQSRTSEVRLQRSVTVPEEVRVEDVEARVEGDRLLLHIRRRGK